MQLRPRHYILFFLVVGLFVFNIVRNRKHKVPVTQQPGAPTSAWSAYDTAAALRDAPDAQFQPAFQNLRTLTETPENAPASAAPEDANLRACKTWLVFYRNPQWRENAKKHVAGCTQFHRDAVAQ
jgi:hypothetical protein